MPTPIAPLITTTIGANYLSWRLPNARGVGATQILRTTNGEENVIVGSVVGSQFVDYVIPGVAYDYRIRFVSETGIAGEWSSEVSVIAANDPSQFVALLQGKIRESELAQSLRDRVVSGGAIDAAIQAERSARILALSSESQLRASEIQAEAQARAQALLAEAQARESAITTEAQLRQNADESLASQVTTLSASLSNDLATLTSVVQTESSARAAGDSSLASQITALSANTNTKISTVTALINWEGTARADADNAIAAQISSLSASVGSNTAAITAEATTRASEDVALSQMLDSLTVTLDNVYAAMLDQIRAEATSESATIAELNLALARISASESAITSEQNIRATADTALSSMITELATTVDTNYANIVNNYYTSTTTDLAVAAAERRAISSVYELDELGVPTALTAEFSEKVKVEVDVAGTAKATFESKVTAGQRTAGFAYGTDGNVSEFYVNADRFAVLSNSGTKQTTPFIVEGDSVYINSAIIKDASIDTAKIANLNTAVANIAKANIYNAAVGGQIYSSNYNLVNKTGWSLNQDGSAFFGSNVTFGGQLNIGSAGQANGVVINNDGIRVYDANGVLRVAIGKLV